MIFPEPDHNFGPKGMDLTGRFVRLEIVRQDHLTGLWESGSDPETWTWMVNKAPETVDEMAIFHESMIERQMDGSQDAFVVFESSTNVIVGSTRLFDFKPIDRSVELGFTWYAPSARGTAINPEAKLLLLHHCFESLNANRVQLKTDVRNARSRRAIEKLGAEFEGVLRKLQTRFDGYVRDSAMYSITRDDWPSVQARLQERLEKFS